MKERKIEEEEGKIHTQFLKVTAIAPTLFSRGSLIGRLTANMLPCELLQTKTDDHKQQLDAAFQLCFIFFPCSNKTPKNLNTEDEVYEFEHSFHR